MSTRDQLREKRRRERQRSRLTAIVIVVGIALVLTGLLILPNLTPITDVVQAEPLPRPQAEGTSAGDPAAPVMVEVFEDFQCPSCKRFNELVDAALMEEYVATGEVYYVFRQYPFIGPESVQAAHASLCAADQRRFWDYHDMIFANQTGENVGAYSDRRLEAFAATLGMDTEQFNTCMKEQRHEERLDQEFQLGIEMGVTGTPAVFVNGQQISPGFVPSYEQVKAAIEAALP